MVNILSLTLEKCKSKTGRLQIYYDAEDQYFSIPLYFHGVQGYYMFFDPWSGNEISGTFDLYTENAEVSRVNWDNKIAKYNNSHISGSVCDQLSWFLKGGDEENLTPIIHIPNIRTYAILNKKKYGGFEPIDYCPFCGAKFPDRLDEKLTEILRKEYGLNSWKDYKQAPPEFRTDEWWIKRGL